MTGRRSEGCNTGYTIPPIDPWEDVYGTGADDTLAPPPPPSHLGGHLPIQISPSGPRTDGGVGGQILLRLPRIWIPEHTPPCSGFLLTLLLSPPPAPWVMAGAPAGNGDRGLGTDQRLEKLRRDGGRWGGGRGVGPSVKAAACRESIYGRVSTRGITIQN